MTEPVIPHWCPECGALMGVTPAGVLDASRVGHAAVCPACAIVSVQTIDGIRRATDEEREALMQNPLVRETISAAKAAKFARGMAGQPPMMLPTLRL